MNIQKLITDLNGWGVKQAELATAIGVTQSRISQVIRTPLAGFRGQATLKLLALHEAYKGRSEAENKSSLATDKKSDASDPCGAMRSVTNNS